MRTTKLLLATLKENPADAEIVSHQLMLRAGMIRKLASGLYSWLPLGLRILRKVEQIIRQEMDKSGAQELLMPVTQPAELWQESGRWHEYGAELLRFNDRHNREFAMGPTHEEVITDIARRELRSYRDLPVNFYQIQTKFRDEVRPRFGIMRAREFTMKDAYSFHIDTDSLDITYQEMHKAYSNIFTRLGLEFRAVSADSGSIGGSSSHEFHVLAESGEDAIAFSTGGKYAANIELAEATPPKNRQDAEITDLTKVATPGKHSIDEVCQFLSIKPEQSVKTLIVEGVGETLVALVLRGDHELNEIKAGKLSSVTTPITFASDEAVKKATGSSPGSLGPIGLEFTVIVDHSAAALTNFVCGANEDGFHFTGTNWERDLPQPVTADLRNVCHGDDSPDGNGTLEIARGIEVGHIFKLGDKYSKAMKAEVLDESGKTKTMTMGCYGIGVTRIIAAAIEQNHDENGIIWSETLAPFQVAIVPINMHKSQRLREAVEDMYTKLTNCGIEVLLDDRKERPGVMFADMELIGIPHRIVLGERGLDKGIVEYKNRRTGEVKDIAITEIDKVLV